MNKEKRQHHILNILRNKGEITLSELCMELPSISQVTLRRDIAELAKAEILIRTHGGAKWREPQERFNQSETSGATLKIISVLDDLDAIILPPISGRGSEALRRQIRRSGIPYLAESAPQEGGVYLGPDNFQAAYALGKLAAKTHKNTLKATVLLVSQLELSNTRARSNGFRQGFKETFAGYADFLEINGGGSYKSALQVTSDALQANTNIDIIFGVNDHSALAALDSVGQNQRLVSVYATGGEKADFVAQCANGGLLKAVATFFPTVVGILAIDAIARCLSGQPLTTPIQTPFAVITEQNIDHYFDQDALGHYALKPTIFESLLKESHCQPSDNLVGCRVGFMVHYPAHDWYRAMIVSMQQRCEYYGMRLDITPPHQSISDELLRLQQMIAIEAVAKIHPHETIIIGEGAPTLRLAIALAQRAQQAPESFVGVTVITNALDVIYQLQDTPAITTILTCGEYHKMAHCLVGSSVDVLFERVRADKAFITAAGITESFGLSNTDEKLALVGNRFIQAAKRTIVLMDHTLVGVDANHRIARIHNIDEIISDEGILPIERQWLRSAHIDITFAKEMDDEPPLSPINVAMTSPPI